MKYGLYHHSEKCWLADKEGKLLFDRINARCAAIKATLFYRASISAKPYKPKDELKIHNQLLGEILENINLGRARYFFKSPKGKVFYVSTIAGFVQSNPSEFEPLDIVWSRTKTEYKCKATKGLQSLVAGKKWKGWSIVK